MKNTLAPAVAFLAMAFLGTSAHAEDLAPPVFRCTSCGAQYQVKTKVTKDNTVQMKFEKIPSAGNPKFR